MARELEHIRMGQLVEGDWLVREDAIGTVLVRGVVKPPGRRCTVLYVKDGDVREYPTWKSTHARAMRGAGPPS